MRLFVRILLGMLLPVALLTAAAIYQLRLIRSLQQENRELVNISLQARRLALDVDSKLLALGQLADRFIVRRDVDYVGELRRRQEDITGQIRTLQALRLTALERAQMRGVESAWGRYVELATEIEAQMLDEGRAEGDTVLEQREVLRTGRDELLRLDQAIRHAIDERLRASGEYVDRGRQVSAITAASSLVVALITAVLIADGLSRGLRRLAAGAHELAAGHFAFRVPPHGTAELRELATDFNWMAERLGELDRLKSDFVSSVSHDLKAPLASMQETTRLLLEGTPGGLSERQRRLLQLNLQCSDRLSSMIADLLDLARLEAGAMKFERERTDLRGLAEQAISELSALGTAAKVEIDQRFPSTPLWVDVDHQWIVRALWNLLSNAVRYSPADSRIDTAGILAADREELLRHCPLAPVHASSPAVLLTVRDRGPGIPEAERGLIFERFYRAPTARRDGRGTGLGLAISRQVVRLHGGEVWVEPAGGGGSLFAISLPPAEGSSPPQDHA
ncbi:MAG: ATP-binding protein [Thermoanaerobaculia bacterium]